MREKPKGGPGTEEARFGEWPCGEEGRMMRVCVRGGDPLLKFRGGSEDSREVNTVVDGRKGWLLSESGK
jgi:hypothetical protein